MDIVSNVLEAIILFGTTIIMLSIVILVVLAMAAYAIFILYLVVSGIVDIIKELLN